MPKVYSNWQTDTRSNMDATTAEPTTKHTPGPWDVEDRGTYTAIVPRWDTERDTDEFAGRHIATVRDGFKGGDMGYSGHNARLISAAPDLLAALYDIYELMSDTGYYGLFKPQLDAARAAISKAKGGSK